MKKLFLAALVLSVLASLASAQEGPKQMFPESKLTKVTVYADRAQVTRSATIDIREKGLYSIVFQDLPKQVDQNSIRSKAEGSQSLRFLGIETVPLSVNISTDAKARSIREDIIRLSDQMSALQNELDILRAEQSFVSSLQVQSAEKASRDIGAGKADLDDVRDVLDFIKETLRDNGTKTIETEQKIRTVSAKMDDKEGELASLESEPKEYTKALVNIDATEPCKLAIELTYVTMQATWQPKYDVRVREGGKKVEMSYYGFVTQATGEGWDNVELTLSTAKPYLGAKMPELAPHFIEGVPIPEDQAPEPITAEEKPALSSDTEKIFSVFFSALKSESIPSDNLPHKTTLAVLELDAALAYESIPKLSGYAYLKAGLTNTAKFPLLAGSMNVFWGSDFVGLSSMRTISPSEKFFLYLGVDESIQIKRKQEKKFIDQTGGFLRSTKKRNTFGYRVTAANFKNESVKVSISDQIPVAQTADIVVELTEATPTPDDQTLDGKMTWTIDLKPGEKKEIYFEFQIIAPPAVKVQGMED